MTYRCGSVVESLLSMYKDPGSTTLPVANGRETGEERETAQIRGLTNPPFKHTSHGVERYRKKEGMGPPLT